MFARDLRHHHALPYDAPMDLATIRQALQRTAAVFAARPSQALVHDRPALARWEDGLECRVTGPHGATVRTSLPSALGGAGDAPTPGWYLRAAQASCLATAIVMRAATTGIAIRALEVEYASDSDARGVLALPGAQAVGPVSVRVRVRIDAAGAEAELRALIDWAVAHSPVLAANRDAPRPELRVEFVDHGA
jgi:uncharacterized OsmC-like protein